MMSFLGEIIFFNQLWNFMNKIKINYSYIYLLIAFVALFFYNGRWIVPLAAFIAPLFIIRFLRLHKPLKGFIFILLVCWISNIFIWEGMMPISGPFYYVLMFMMSLFSSLTYLIDRIYSKKIKGIVSSLIFPATYVLMEYIVILTNPSGSYGTFAHTQSNLTLLQFLSITGVWGVTFFVLWTASVLNWLWDNSFEKDKIFRVLIVYGIPAILILLFGQIRLATGIESNTVRVASVNINESCLYKRYDALDKIYTNKAWSDFEEISKQINDNFLDDCHKASLSGAKIIFGTESILCLKHTNEKEFLERAKLIAKQDSIFLGLPMQVLVEGFPNELPQIKIIWISPEGKELLTYHKTKPTPGEGSYGDGLLKYFDTPFGRISTSICFDMDFPQLINQISDKNIDIMLVPSNDWPEIAPYHTYVSSFRAIEQGFNLVRATSKGLSASFNYKGQLLASFNYYKTNELIFYTDIPVKGQKTVYASFGDYFAWLSILFLIIISGIILKRNIKSKSTLT